MSPILLPAHNASGWTGPTGNNTYLLTGAVPTLIDAGVGAAAHVDAISKALDGAALSLVLITHGHPDHASGVPVVARRWPAVKVLQYPGTGHAPIRAGDTELTPLHTPGHAPDHVCFLDSATRDVYCGDLVRLGGSIVIPASRGGNMGQYLESLRQIRALEPSRLLPGHGGIIDKPTHVLDEYLLHREERGRQVLHALSAEAATPQQIAARVYPDLAPALLDAAGDTVHAHLIYLEEQGMAVRHRGHWTI